MSSEAPSNQLTAPLIDTLAVIGVGLIGGSFAAALRRAGVVKRIVGAGRRPETLDKARELGLIDEVVSYEQAAQADVIFLGTPVGAMTGVLAQLLPTLRATSVITDGGSTKQDVIGVVRQVMKTRALQFVPGHPMAGSHEMGPSAARADLYQNRRVMLTPIEENRQRDIALVASLWQACGADVITLDPQAHDAALASISHLPHWVSALYVMHVLQTDNPNLRLELAGSGFKDFTRIAQGSPEMWRDIFLSNRDALLEDIAAFRLMLDRAESALLDKDSNFIESFLVEASDARRDWKGFGE